MSTNNPSEIPNLESVRERLVGHSVVGARQSATILDVRRWQGGDAIRDYIDARISDDRKGPVAICIVRSGSYRGRTIKTDSGLLIGYELGAFANSHAKLADAADLVKALMTPAI